MAVARQALTAARALFDQGRWEESQRKLEEVDVLRDSLDADGRRDFVRLRASVQTRRGFLDGPLLLAELARDEESAPLWLITDYAFVFRYSGLAPSPEMAAWLRRGEDRLARGPSETLETVTAFQDHQAYGLLTEGHPRKAIKLLKPVCQAFEREGQNARILSRAQVTLAEAYRRTGGVVRAQALLNGAMAAQAEHHFRGDLSDLTLPCLAKLQADPERARSILADARSIQRELGNLVGEARTLLLEARLAAGVAQAAAAKERVLELQRHVPLLQECWLVRKILDRWDAWAGGQRAADESGDLFWRL